MPSYNVDKNTVAKYMPKPLGPPRRPSPTWSTFVRTHLAGTIAIDFLMVPTVTFDILGVFFVLSLERGRILHVNVSSHPNAAWAAQQIVDAVGLDAAVVRMIRDRDSVSSCSAQASSTLVSGSSAPRQDRLGKTDSRKDSSAPYGASCSTK